MPPSYPAQQYLKAPPMVIYAHLKCRWAKGERDETLHYLRDFSEKLAQDIQAGTSGRGAGKPAVDSKLEGLSRLLARCYYKLGEWQFALKEEWETVSLSYALGCGRWLTHEAQRNMIDILLSYNLATHYDPEWYKAWHTWALANFEVVVFLENQQFNRISDVPGQELTAHIVSSVTGLCGLLIV